MLLSEVSGVAMRRRDFFRLVGSAAATWPFEAHAQPREPLRRVAILEPIAADTPGAQARYTAFLEGLKQLGWTDRQNIQIVVRWGADNEVKAHKYSEELVALAPDVILAVGSTGAGVMLKSYSHHSNCLCHRPRPGRLWICRTSIASGRQHHRLHVF